MLIKLMPVVSFNVFSMRVNRGSLKGCFMHVTYKFFITIQATYKIIFSTFSQFFSIFTFHLTVVVSRAAKSKKRKTCGNRVSLRTVAFLARFFSSRKLGVRKTKGIKVTFAVAANGCYSLNR